MLTPTEIMDAISERLRERFPGEEIYRHELPNGAARPALLITYGPVKMLDANTSLVDLTPIVTIKAFVVKDDAGRSDAEALLTKMASLQELFSVTGVRVRDRVLHVIQSIGTCNADHAEVTATLNYLDDRPGAGEWPLMGSVDINIKEE